MENREIFILNNEEISLDFNGEVILLDILRNDLGLKGTKEVCREGDCGACTVLMGEITGEFIKYKNVNSCILHKTALPGKHIVSIEGLRLKDKLSFIQQEFYNEGGTQCGYCTPGFILSVTGYFLELTTRKLRDFEYEYKRMLEYVSGNICRCTGHISIKRSLKNLLIKFSEKFRDKKITLETLVSEEIIPEYFLTIKNRLQKFNKRNIITSGGTDLLVQNMHQIENINLKYSNQSDSALIYKDQNDIVIGAFATVTDVCDSQLILKYFPEIATYRELFGSFQIRNKATIGGNIFNASPIGDSVNIFMALDAKLQLTNATAQRTVRLREFYTGYKKNIAQKNEVLLNIRIKVPSNDYIFSYEKVSKRLHLDIASVNSTMYLEKENGIILNASISAGGVAPFPLYLKNTSDYLIGKEITADIFDDLEDIINCEISPIDDVRGSAEYKRVLLFQLIKMHFIKYYPKLIEELV